MARARPTADVSGWMHSVAEVLPIPHRAHLPYTLGEAVAELGAYARATDAARWETPASRKNRTSLQSETAYQLRALGGRLQRSLGHLLDDLKNDTVPQTIADAAARFGETWHSPASISDAFHDLCDAAQVSGTTSRALRKRSSIIASQIGPAAGGHFSKLSRAADALVETKEDLARFHDRELPVSLTEAYRLELAEKLLFDEPTGHVVIWLVYYRAMIRFMRTEAGPMTFLRAEWALPNAFDDGPNDFPERAELQSIRDDVYWLEDLRDESMKLENQLILVRIDLGHRQVAGAVDEARRRIEAVLSVAVEAGGVSWRSAHADATMLDGKIRGCSVGLVLQDAPAPEDSYGMGATGQMLLNVAEQLGEALRNGPMPDPLVEALGALREARMTDHRDVIFYNARPTTPRVAIALEDHAMELIASVLHVKSEALADALQRRETIDEVDRRIAGQLVGPFNDTWSRVNHEGRRELEREIFAYSESGRVVSIVKAIALESRLRALPMTELELADLDDALRTCTSPNMELSILDEAWRETTIVRRRHRRVRNAINHGLPLSSTTLNSVRQYAQNTSAAALNLALTWFKTGGEGAILVAREEDAWIDRRFRIEDGRSWADEAERYEVQPDG